MNSNSTVQKGLNKKKCVQLIDWLHINTRRQGKGRELKVHMTANYDHMMIVITVTWLIIISIVISC